MSRRREGTYQITGPDIELSGEVIFDRSGRRIDQAYVDRAVAEVEDDLA